MPYVLKAKAGTRGNGRYVREPGVYHEYTAKIQEAARFQTLADADAERIHSAEDSIECAN